MTAVNFLYLGMSHDVLFPFHLAGHIDTLYVIDMVQFGYARRKTVTSIRVEIANIMQRGAYSIAGTRFSNSCELPHGPIVLGDEHRSGKRWECEFLYNGRRGRLVRFEGDFLSEWPVEVTGITHFTGLGAFDVDYLKNPVFRRMMRQRLAPQCSLFFDLTPWTGLAVPPPRRRAFPCTTIDDTEICVVHANTRSADWLDDVFSKRVPPNRRLKRKSV